MAKKQRTVSLSRAAQAVATALDELSHLFDECVYPDCGADFQRLCELVTRITDNESSLDEEEEKLMEARSTNS